jgi:dUTP pyrophosphatase
MAKLPKLATPNAVGLDLYADESTIITPGDRKVVRTGIGISLPSHTYGCIAPQSGLAMKHGIDIGADMINQDYTGELKVLLINQWQVPFIITQGDHIAQLIVEKYQVTIPKEVSTLKNTN